MQQIGTFSLGEVHTEGRGRGRAARRWAGGAYSWLMSNETITSPGRPVRTTALAETRTVESVHRSTTFHWVGNGFYVSTYFPSQALAPEQTSPFVLMDYGPPKEFTPLARGKRGVGWHPHRGFETVTLAWEGAVAHRDNAGHAGIIGPGDVQWMTAGGGIFHEEYHEDASAGRAATCT